MQNSTITSMNSRDPILLVNPDAELYRRFTPREAARIQSFPDEFLLNDSEPKSYKQIGNAVPPVFMWYVARQLQKAIAANSNLSEAEIAAFMTTHPAGAFSPAKPKQECIQLNFLDMLDEFEGVNSEAMMVREDEPIAYGRYRAPMYPTEFHEKFYIARGNVFDVESFWADGVAAFVKGGFNNISASYDEFKSHPHITDFVKFSVKISIIIDYLRNSCYLCRLKIGECRLHLGIRINSSALGLHDTCTLKLGDYTHT